MKNAASHPRRVWAHVCRIAALWVFLFAAYSNSFQSGFVFDNAPLILQDTRVRAATERDFRLILDGGYWPGHKNSGLYRPITTSSFLLNYAVFGSRADPASYHWFNLIFHCVNAALVYALGVLIFAAPEAACALAAIWGLHPLMTESVTNIVGRADVLAAFGVLAGLLCYAKGRDAEGRRKFAWLAGFVCSLTIGLFSKENAAVLPALMLLFDFAWRARQSFAKRAMFYAAAAAVFAAFFWCRAQSNPSMAIFFTDNPLIATGFSTARLMAMNVMGRYLWLFLWPAHLSADYSFNAIPISGTWATVTAFLSIGICVAALIFAISRRRRQPALFFFVIFFFVTLLPTSNLLILIGSIMAERFAYLPAIGLAGCLVIGVQALALRISKRWKGSPRIAWTAVGLACLALAARTYGRNFDWRDDLALWSSAVEVCPESAKAHMNLGHAYSEMPGRLEDAIKEYDVALGIEPDYAPAHYNRGTALSKLSGQTDRAIADYTAALRSDPDYAEAHVNLGKTLAQIPGRLPEAISEYQSALRIEPDDAQAHNNLGNALASIPGRMPEALAQYNAALEIDPDFAEAHYDLANAIARVPGRLPEAIAEYRKAIAAQPDVAASHSNLGIALMQSQATLADAISEFEAAVRLEPGDANAHLNLGMALSQSPGRMAEAIAELESAVRIDPNLAQAHYNLGVALSRTPGRSQEAIRELEAALRIRPDAELRQAIERLREAAR